MRNIAGIVVVATVLAPTAAWASDPREDALLLSKQALDAYLAGDFARAAEFYGEAYSIWPKEPLYLYNAGRAAERAEQLAEAERMYQLYLEHASSGQAEVAKARFHLDEIRATRKSAAHPDGRPAPRPGQGVTRGAVGTGLLIAGGVVAFGGGLMLAFAATDQSTLDQRFAQVDAEGHIIGISLADASSQQNVINTRKYIGWTMLGTGVAVGVTGVVLMATAPAAGVVVAPWPDGRGAELAWRF